MTKNISDEVKRLFQTHKEFNTIAGILDVIIEKNIIAGNYPKYSTIKTIFPEFQIVINHINEQMKPFENTKEKL